MKALLVGNSGDLADSIPFCLRLRWSDAEIVRAGGGADIAELVRREAPDIVLTDFRLPDMPCRDLAKRLRAASDVPLVVLAGNGDQTDRTRLLDAGADDYIVSPNSALEVLSKLSALFRRTSGNGFAQSPTFVVGNISIGPSPRQVTVDGKQIRLTRHEYDLLSVLVKNAGKVLSHGTLLRDAWGPAYSSDVPLLKKYIYRLRQKLNDDADAPLLILTERGIGYRFVRQRA